MIYINFICIFFLILLLLIFKNNYKEELKKLNKQAHPFILFYPGILFFMDKLEHIKTSPNLNKIGEALGALHIGEKAQDLHRYYRCKKIATVCIIVTATNVLSLFSSLNQSSIKDQLIEGKYIERGQYGEGESNTNLYVTVDNDQDTLLEEEFELEVQEREYTQEEISELFKEGTNYIDLVVLSNNQDANYITSDLYFPSSIPLKGIKVTWFTGNNKVLDSKGHVYNEDLETNVIIEVWATLKYKKNEITYIRSFNIYPKEYTKEELIHKSLSEEIQKKDFESVTQERLELPTKIGELDVTWSQVKEKQSNSLFILGLFAAVLIYFIMDKDLMSKVNKRNDEMLIDYPDIINKFTLLIGAGMSTSNAWTKIAKDYKDKGGAYKYAYEEMNITARELSVGVSEITAYERFGNRVRLLPYLRFSSFLTRNVKKGSKDLLELLELEGLEAFEERKELAKRLGEEAGTKLLIPMMLMLVIVLAIIMVPAFTSFQF